MEDLRLVEVVVEDVGVPRSDGTEGSALYRVPIRLNRAPDAFEARALHQVWDNPPAFTTMHRPGILRVEGDRLVLDGTTVEEVEQVHRETLILVVNEVNRLAASMRQEEERERAKAKQHDEQHRRHVRDVAERIQFEE